MRRTWEKVVHSETAQKYDSAVVKSYPPGGISEATESALTTLPGVGVNRTSMTPIRYYPNGSFFSHAMGYTSAITADEINTLDSERYDISSYVGRTGLEAAYEDTLCGTKGYSLDIYASDGQWLSTVARKEAVDGLDLEITLDYDLQVRAEEILATLYLWTTSPALRSCSIPRPGTCWPCPAIRTLTPTSLSSTPTRRPWPPMSRRTPTARSTTARCRVPTSPAPRSSP